jgi:hypothetical protein
MYLMVTLPSAVRITGKHRVIIKPTLRWDQSDLSIYELQTRSNLAEQLVLPKQCLLYERWRECDHRQEINEHYRQTVCALNEPADATILQEPCCDYFKPYWNEELNRLKEDCIFWHKLWVNVDKPASLVRPVFNRKLNVKNDIVLKRQRCMSAKL